jgi:hypothetical protein
MLLGKTTRLSTLVSHTIEKSRRKLSYNECHYTLAVLLDAFLQKVDAIKAQAAVGIDSNYRLILRTLTQGPHHSQLSLSK